MASKLYYKVMPKRNLIVNWALSFLLFGFLISATAIEEHLDIREEPKDGTRRLTSEVVGFEVYYAGSLATKITDLSDGAVVDFSKIFFLLRPKAVTLKAILTNEASTDSVVFDLDGDTNYSVDNATPYFLCGDIFVGLIPSECSSGFDYGQHTITATPFSGGVAGTALTVTFTMVERARATPCGTPKFIGPWEPIVPYPLEALVAQGAMFGDDFVVISGFNFTNFPSLPTAYAETYALNVTNPKAVWRRMDDCPLADGLTHTGQSRVGDKLYLCGGNVGGNPGPDLDTCFIYDHSVEPGTTGQWSEFTSLPEARSAGGMVYDTKRNSLFYAGGQVHPIMTAIAIIFSINRRDHWMLDLGNLSAGWVRKTQTPYVGTHIGHVTAYDELSKERHFFVGGQSGENRWTGQRDGLFEWNAETETWTGHAPLPFARSHIQSATVAVGCGFITMGGLAAWNRYLDDIHYYDIPTDTWEKIGTLPSTSILPVCALHSDYLYCATAGLSHRRKFVLE